MNGRTRARRLVALLSQDPDRLIAPIQRIEGESPQNGDLNHSAGDSVCVGALQGGIEQVERGLPRVDRGALDLCPGPSLARLDDRHMQEVIGRRRRGCDIVRHACGNGEIPFYRLRAPQQHRASCPGGDRAGHFSMLLGDIEVTSNQLDLGEARRGSVLDHGRGLVAARRDGQEVPLGLVQLIALVGRGPEKVVADRFVELWNREAGAGRQARGNGSTLCHLSPVQMDPRLRHEKRQPL
jgi:hypothetical protein